MSSNNKSVQIKIVHKEEHPDFYFNEFDIPPSITIEYGINKMGHFFTRECFYSSFNDLDRDMSTCTDWDQLYNQK
jgi:hypothetical protein